MTPDKFFGFWTPTQYHLLWSEFALIQDKKEDQITLKICPGAFYFGQQKMDLITKMAQCQMLWLTSFKGNSRSGTHLLFMYPLYVQYILIKFLSTSGVKSCT